VSQYLTVARLVRPHGIRGELAAELDADGADWLKPGREVELWDGGVSRRRVRVQGLRPHRERVLVQLEGVDTRTAAEQIAGWKLQIRADSRPAAPAGRYYIADLVGCEVVSDGPRGVLGRVAGWMETGAVPLLEVRDGAREILIPFAASICVDIDPAGRTIRVRLPEGLEELE